MLCAPGSEARVKDGESRFGIIAELLECGGSFEELL